jgi:hypothetical protein
MCYINIVNNDNNKKISSFIQQLFEQSNYIDWKIFVIYIHWSKYSFSDIPFDFCSLSMENIDC